MGVEATCRARYAPIAGKRRCSFRFQKSSARAVQRMNSVTVITAIARFTGIGALSPSRQSTQDSAYSLAAPTKKGARALSTFVRLPEVITVRSESGAGRWAHRVRMPESAWSLSRLDGCARRESWTMKRRRQQHQRSQQKERKYGQRVS